MKNGTTEICPITGEVIRSRPEWTDVAVGDKYAVTVRVLGDHIIHGRPRGYADLQAAKTALKLTDEVRAECLDPHLPYIHISDYTDLKGASAEARRCWSSAMGERRDVLALIFCGAAAWIRIGVKLGKRLGLARSRVELVRDYPTAVAKARSILEDAGIANAPMDAPRSGLAGPAESEIWDHDLYGMRLRFKVVGPRVLYAAAQGHFKEEHAPRIFEVLDMEAGELGAEAETRTLIADLTQVHGTTFSARQRFLENARVWFPANGFDLIVTFGASRRLKTAVKVFRSLPSVRVKIADSFEEALILVDRHRTRWIPILKGQKPWQTLQRSLLGRAKDRHVEDLLSFLGSIDWESEGLGVRPPGQDQDHPLARVFDAIELIKEDVDRLFEERRRTEESARQSEERYRSILASIVEGYFEVDLKGNVTFFNDTVLETLGYSAEELKGLSYRSFLDETTSEKVRSTFSRVYRTGEPTPALKWEIVRKGGTVITVEASVLLMRDSQGRPVGFRGVVRDITERVRAEEEKKRLESQLLHAQRLEALGTLAGGIAHNFNNLLMGILGNVSTLLVETDHDSPSYQRLKTMESLVESGSRLTGQLLGYARAGRTDVKPFDLALLLSETVETFSLTKRNIRIHQQWVEATSPVRADRRQIEQVLLNLFINAAEAMPQGGELFVETQTRSQDPSDPSSPDLVTVTVRDTGSGMDQETQDRVFEPFFTTKGITGGTGLGLSSAYGIVTAHGGSIEVSSQPGQGSVFRVHLPAADEAVQDDDTGPVPIRGGKGTIMVVDDDSAVLESISAMLSHLDYSPLTASSGREALEMFAEQQESIDLVILDMILPDQSGSELFDKIRDMDPSSRVLLASGYSLEGEAEQILNKGCDGFIQKPFTLNELSRRIGNILSSH